MDLFGSLRKLLGQEQKRPAPQQPQVTPNPQGGVSYAGKQYAEEDQIPVNYQNRAVPLNQVPRGGQWSNSPIIPPTPTASERVKMIVAPQMFTPVQGGGGYTNNQYYRNEDEIPFSPSPRKW